MISFQKKTIEKNKFKAAEIILTILSNYTWNIQLISTAKEVQLSQLRDRGRKTQTDFIGTTCEIRTVHRLATALPGLIVLGCFYYQGVDFL